MPKFDAYYKWLGIPPSEQPPHHYRLLGITPFETDADVIDAAADRQMSFLRDCGNGPNLSESQRLLNQVSEARITLLNASKKAAYDQNLRQKLAPAAPPPVAQAVIAKPAVAKPAVTKPAESFQINTRGASDPRPTPAAAGGSSRWIAVGGALAAVIVLAVVASRFMGGGPSVAVYTAPSTTKSPEVPSIEPKPQPPVEPPKAQTKVQAPKPPGETPRPVEAPKKPPEPEPQPTNTTPKTAPPATATPTQTPDEPPAAERPTPEPKKEFDPLLPRQVDPTKPAEKRPGVIDENEPAPKRPLVVAQAEPPKEPKTQRLPVPDRPAMQAAEKLIKDLFKSEYTSKKPEDRAALAKKLLAQGKDSPDDAAARYVLFNESREVAVSVGDAETALSAFRETAKLFDVNRADEEAGLLAALANKVRTPEAAKLVIDAAVALIDSSIASDDYDSAKRALALASASARKTQNVALITQLASRTREIDQLKRDFAGAQSAQEKLKSSPDDAEANLTLGKFYAFGKGDFERGLPYLAKGSDEGIAEAAKSELAKPDKPEGQLALADTWWAMGEKEKEPMKGTLQNRAGEYYRLALPTLKGLAKTQVEAKLKDTKRTPVVTSRSPLLQAMTSGPLTVSWKTGTVYDKIQLHKDGTCSHITGLKGSWRVDGEVVVVDMNTFVERYWLENGRIVAECYAPPTVLKSTGVARPVE